MSIDVIGYGRGVKDYLCIVDEIPEKNGFARSQGVTSQCGGKVSTAMAACARLGVKSAMMGVVGGDYNGNFVREDFIRHGVDVSHLAVDPDGSNVYCWGIASLKHQSRMFIGMEGTARAYAPEEMDEDFIRQAKVVHVDCGDAAAVRLLELAHRNGIVTAIDADSYTPEIEALEPQIDWFIASEFYYEARAQGKMTPQEFCRQLVRQGSKIAIVTLGERGCVGCDGERVFALPAYSNVSVVDTTGAGDVFHGAFLAGMVRGMACVEAARFASAVSAIKCTRIGGRAGIPDWEMTMTFMQTGEIVRQEELDARVAFYRQAYVG